MTSNPFPRTPLLPLFLLGLVAAVWPGSAAGAITVEVSADSSETSTRVMLTHSDSVVNVIQSSRNKLSILYVDPVEVSPPQMRFDEPILDRYETQGDRSLVLYTGSDYTHYETFELRNPYRLIIDLHGSPSRRERRAARRLRAPETIIVIDPGHGGIEHGAAGPTGLKEKDVTLALARRLRLALQAEDAAISVVLTRDEDRLVGLDERTGVANHNRADLFLSIHVNASPRASASGAETYFLSPDATDDEARILAAMENRSSKSTKNPRPSGGDLDLILWDLAQNQYLAESGALAESVQKHLNRLTGTRNRGVRQAPFRVLMGATMPAILVEVGFITNTQEEARLRTATYRDQVVEAVVAAVREFLLNLDRFSKPGSSGRRGAGRP